ncbi:MAG TPA: PAS domain-containing protein, partial [Planctomycetota bacterium]|nr:PAS domain-containing protein [Planctomycetota bacterium]
MQKPQGIDDHTPPSPTATPSRAAQAHERLYDIVQGLDAIVWEADEATGRITFVSQRAEGLLGFPVDRWLTEPDFWERRLHPDDRERVLAARRDPPEGGHDPELVYRATASDGRVLWLRDVVRVTRAPDGTPRLIRAVTLDVSERKRTEDALRSSQARKAAILEASLDAIVSMDHKGRIVEF